MKKEIYLILDNIRSAYNVGSIFRTADGAGVTKIYLCGYTAHPSRGQATTSAELQIAKTALGAEKAVPWEYYRQTGRLVKKLKKDGIKIVALEVALKSKNIFKYKPRFPLAILLGNEVRGLNKTTLMYADDILEIPMYGHKESLNVSVAAGVALYQIKYPR